MKAYKPFEKYAQATLQTMERVLAEHKRRNAAGRPFTTDEWREYQAKELSGLRRELARLSGRPFRTTPCLERDVKINERKQ